MCFKGALSSTLPGGRRKPEQFSLVINDQVEFESIEPPKRAFPFPGKFLEGFMLLFSFDMAASDESRIDKRYAGTLPQSLHFLGRQQAGYRLFALTLQIGCRTRYGGNQTSCVIGRRDRNASDLEKRRSGKG